jgi:hypothetical protein
MEVAAAGIEGPVPPPHAKSFTSALTDITSALTDVKDFSTVIKSAFT